MLRKYYDCNNSVTNVESGSKSAIVKSGHQIRHYQNWARPSHAPRTRRALIAPRG